MMIAMYIDQDQAAEFQSLLDSDAHMQTLPVCMSMQLGFWT